MQEGEGIKLSEVIKGLDAASLEAIQTARRTGTKLAIWRDGKVEEITPDEAEQMMDIFDQPKAHKE
ncbi:MAG: hypothetical protein AB7E52_00445 [Bdellovibrionales bacterium]